MALAYDSFSSSGYEAALSTYNWSHTMGILALRGILVVGVGILAAGTVLSITYGGLALTFIRSDVNGIYRSELWYVLNPPVGITSITVNLSASLTSIAGAVSYADCGGIGTNNGATGTNTPATVSVTPVQDGALILAALVANTTSGVSDNGGQTNRWTNSGALGSSLGSDKGPITPAAATSLIFNGLGVTDSWAISAAAILNLEHRPIPVYRV